MSGVCNGTEVSDNFILKWGLDAPPADDEVELIMEALETSWNHQLEIMGHAAPYGTDDYLFNVYVGDSGGCAPSARGVGGYYTTDDEGWPIIVLSQGVFNNLDYGQTTVAHEFYHAVQHAEGAFAARGSVQWWWEATAMWVEGEVYPGTEDYYSFLYGYAFEPHLQLNAYTGLTSAGLLEEYHQYGAAIWPRYLTEYVTSWTTIRDTWAYGRHDDDPIEYIAECWRRNRTGHRRRLRRLCGAQRDLDFHGENILAISTTCPSRPATGIATGESRRCRLCGYGFDMELTPDGDLAPALRLQHPAHVQSTGRGHHPPVQGRGCGQ